MLGYLSIALEEQRSRYFLWVPVLLGAGSGAYFALKFEPVLPLGVWLVGLLTLLAGGIYVRSTIVRLLLAGLFCVALGLALATLRTHMVAAPVLAEPFFGAVEGRVVKLDRSQSNRLRITLDRVILYGLEPQETPARVRITLPSKDAASKAGGRVLIYARLDGPGAPVEPGGFDFRRWAWFHQLGGVGYALGPLLPSATAPERPISIRLVQTRHWLSDLIRREIPGNNGAFAAAILTGDRSEIDPALLNDLRASNLAHLLAISGLHMGLLTGFIFGLFRYGIAIIPNLALRVNAKKLGAAAAMPVGLAYLLISGASIATQRAYVMVLVVLIAVLLDRPAFTLRAVALAALIILIISPESVTQVGFQMSFAATVGLVVGFEALRHLSIWKRPVTGWKKFAKGAFSVAFSSAVAGMATAPFAAFHFNQFAQYGLVANLLAVPLMGFVVMPAAIIALLLAPFGLGGIFFWAAGTGIGLILSIAQIVAGWDGSVIRIASGNLQALPIFAGGCLMAILWLGRVRFAGVVVACLGLVLWGISERPTVLIDASGKLVGVMTPQGRALNKTRGGSFSANSWLENDGDDARQADAGARVWDAPSLVHIKGDGPLNAEVLCAMNEIVIVPDVSLPAQTGCVVIDQATLKKNGATAIYTDGDELIIKGSRTTSGVRPWSSQ